MPTAHMHDDCCSTEPLHLYRSIDREGQPPMFFHISEVAGGQGAGLKVSSEMPPTLVLDATGCT